MIATYSPRSIENVTPRSARTFSSPTEYVFSMSTISMSIAGLSPSPRATRPCRSRREPRERSGMAVAAPFERPGRRRKPTTRRKSTAKEKTSIELPNVRSAAGAESSRKAARFDAITLSAAVCVSEPSGNLRKSGIATRDAIAFGEPGVRPDRQDLRVPRVGAHHLRGAPEDQRDEEERGGDDDEEPADEGRGPFLREGDLPLDRARRNGAAGLLDGFPNRPFEIDLGKGHRVRERAEKEARDERQPPGRPGDEPPESLGRAREGADDGGDGRDRGLCGGNRSGRVAHFAPPSWAGAAAVETGRPSMTTPFTSRMSPTALCHAAMSLR